MISNFDPFAAETIEDPFPFFAALRREAPCYQLPNGAYWMVSRYEDCRRVVLDTETFSSKLVGVMVGEHGSTPRLISLSEGFASNVLAIADPPEHTLQRKLANRAFAPRRMAVLEPDIRALTRELLEALQADSTSSADAMGRYAVLLPMTVICKLIGLPLDDRHHLQAMSDDAVSLVDGINTEEEIARYAQSALELGEYLSNQLDAARANKQPDVLGTLASAVDDPDEPFSHEQATAVLLQLITAGQETTGSLIGSAIMLLGRAPELQQELRNDPSRIPSFVEETLRLESPFYGHFRQATRDTEIAGQPVAAGTRLMVLWASANRDDEVFENPDTVDLDRPNLKQHFAFGHGIHLCIGAELARMEARIALEELLAGTTDIALEDPNPPHLRSLFVRRLTSLPVRLEWKRR